MNGNDVAEMHWARLALDRGSNEDILRGLSDDALEAAQRRLEGAASRIQVIRSQRAGRRPATMGTYETDGTLGPV